MEPLEYGTAPRRRPWGRWLLVSSLVIVGTVVLFGWVSPWLEERAEQRLTREMLAYSLPAGTVVYREDPPAAVRAAVEANDAALYGNGNWDRDYGAAYQRFLKEMPQGWQPAKGSFPPPLMRGGFAGPSAVTFLHERTTRAGVQRLVRVDVIGSTVQSRGARGVMMMSSVSATGTPAQSFAVGPHQAGKMVFFPIGTLRIFAGQPDPADASHLQIPFDLDGQHGVIDAWLPNNDTVRFAVQAGPTRVR